MTIHHLVESVDVVFAVSLPVSMDVEAWVSQADYSFTSPILMNSAIAGYEVNDRDHVWQVVHVTVRTELDCAMSLDIISEELMEAGYHFIVNGESALSQMMDVRYVGDAS